MFPTPDLTLFGISGSHRKGSLNARLLALAGAALPGFARLETARRADLDLPLYDLDRETELPKGLTSFAVRLARADALLLASPEHNASVPAALKNTLDWLSRLPGGAKPLAGKPVLLLSASPGSRGGARGLAHLTDVVATLGATVVAQVAVAAAETILAEAEREAAHPLHVELGTALAKLVNQASLARSAA